MKEFDGVVCLLKQHFLIRYTWRLWSSLRKMFNPFDTHLRFGVDQRVRIVLCEVCLQRCVGGNSRASSARERERERRSDRARERDMDAEIETGQTDQVGNPIKNNISSRSIPISITRICCVSGILLINTRHMHPWQSFCLGDTPGKFACTSAFNVLLYSFRLLSTRSLLIFTSITSLSFFLFNTHEQIRV